jgi:hypothetical protein
MQVFAVAQEHGQLFIAVRRMVLPAMGVRVPFLLVLALTGVVPSWAADCGVPTGAAQLSDGMWQQWHNRLSGEIMQQDAPNSVSAISEGWHSSFTSFVLARQAKPSYDLRHAD